MNARHNILTIAKREIRTFLNNPSSYLSFTLFMVVWEYIFFRNVFLVGEATMRSLFDFLPWMSLIFIPALTMGAFAKERDEGTLELLLTKGVSELHLVLGKFFGLFALASLTQIFTLPIALTFQKVGNMDMGVYAAQLFGSLLYMAAMVALGICISSYFSHQIASMLGTASVIFLLTLVGTPFITAPLPLKLSPILNGVSSLYHLQSLSRGVLDVPHIAYFLTVIVLGIVLAAVQLMKGKYGNQKVKYAAVRLTAFVIIGIAIVLTVLGERIPGRIDLTENKKYTLSQATRDITASLPDIVQITVYQSSELPAQYGSLFQETKDLLREYQRLSNGKITVQFKDPKKDKETEQEAISAGVLATQFQVIESFSEGSSKVGFFGLALEYAGKKEAIPLISQTETLEYQLTSLVSKLTKTDKPVIAFVIGHGEQSFDYDYTTIKNELSGEFEFREISDATKLPQEASDAAMFAVMSPKNEMKQEDKDAIKAFVQSGKSLLFIAETASINPQEFYAQPNVNAQRDLLSDLGITIEDNIVYDLQSFETVRMGDANNSVLVKYPFWIRSISSEDVIGKDLDTVLMPWPSSITIDSEKVKQSGYEAVTLLQTTEAAGEKRDILSISPDQENFSIDGLKQYNLAVALQPALATSSAQSVQKPGKIVVFGNSVFATNDYATNAPENASFMMNSIGWLTQTNALASIKGKTSNFKRLLFSTRQQVSAVMYGNLLFVGGMPAVIVAIWTIRRRRMHKRTFIVKTK